MSQRPENFKGADEDTSATLVAPRFDDDDARRANPVVPLVEAPARERRVRATRRSWTPALLAVALLALAALGGAFIMNLVQGPRAERVQEAEQVPEQNQSVPARTAETPPQPSTPAATQAAPREEALAKPASRDTQTRHARAVAPVPVAVEPAREEVEEDEHEDRRGKGSRKRRGHEDEVEQEMRKALKRARGKAPRLVDVLTPAP